jgi:DNA-binding NtrC family response regulator
VDDDETILAVSSRMLARLGFDVITARDGRLAMELFSRDPGAIELVVLDLTMPHMGGEEAYREMRRLKRDVRVLLSSGYSEREVTQKFAGKGLAGFIQKPYRANDFAAKVRLALGSTGE